MARRNLQPLESIKQALASLITSEGTPVERLLDAYEGLSAALRQPGACTGQLASRAERLERDLDRYAARQGMSTIRAIALMDEAAVRYWATRMLGLAAEAGRPSGPHWGDRSRVAEEG